MKPVDSSLAQLDDYVRALLTEDEAHAYEEDLFARAVQGEAPELAFRESLGHTLRAMKARGTLNLWQTEQGVAELIASGAKVRRYDYDLENPGAPDLSGDFDILVTRVPIALEEIEHLDAEVLAPDGRVLKTMPDITFDRKDGAVYACCERELAVAAAASTTTTRLWARDAKGSKRLIAELR